MMNSQIPESVSRFLGDCSMDIVIRAMYEYGGFTKLDFFCEGSLLLPSPFL